MVYRWIPAWALPDTGSLQQSGNYPVLIRLLGHRDTAVRARARDALLASGVPAVPCLLVNLRAPDPAVRLGVAGILGILADASAIRPLARVMEEDPVIEVRWAAALALGRNPSAEAVPALLTGIQNRSRYVRLGAAQALKSRGWVPGSDEEEIRLHIALQEWEEVRKKGPVAIALLTDLYQDPDPGIRIQVSTLLSHMGQPLPPEIFRPALIDRDPRVRWRAVIAAMDSGVSPSALPRIMARRERTGPDPVAAAILNFLFLGIGYNYLGKWWGFPVFMSYMTIIVLAQLATGPFLPYLVAYPVTAIIAAHTYFTAQQAAENR